MSRAPIGMVIYSCGKCCCEPTICEKCRANTMRANGLPVEWAGKIQGLKQVASGYSGHYASEFSELTTEMRKLCAEARENTHE